MMLVETFTKNYYQFEFDIQIYMDLNEVYTIGILTTDNTQLHTHNVIINESNDEYSEITDLSKKQKDKIISKIDTVLRNYLKTKKRLLSEISDETAIYQGLTSRPSCGCCLSVVCKYQDDTRVNSIQSFCKYCSSKYYSHIINNEVEDRLCPYC